DDFVAGTTVEVASGHVDAAAERRIVSEEVAERAGHLLHLPADELEGADLRPAARPGADNDLVLAGVVDVASGHRDAAAERRIVSEETGQKRHVLAAENFDIGCAAGARRRDDVRHAVAI